MSMEASWDKTMANSEGDLEEAAVLVPLYRGDDGKLMMVLVRRTERGIHGGQIAFPGGKRVSADRTMLDTALREAEEEIGIAAEAIEILEHLPAIETRVTGFRIHPFLAHIAKPLEWRREEQEIDEVLEVSVTDLAHPDAYGEEMRHFPGRSEPQRISYYRVGQYKVWGATYRILRPLIPRLLGEEWPV